MNNAEILNEIISLNQIGYWIHNLEKRTIKCSLLAKELLEINQNENQYIYTDKDFFEIVNKIEINELYEYIYKLIHLGDLNGTFIFKNTSSVKYKNLNIGFIAKLSEQKEISIIYISIQDVTQQFEIENELFHQKEFLDKVIDNIPVGVFAKDAKNEYRFTIWNNKMEELLGYSKTEMLGKNDYDLVKNIEEIKYFRNTDIEVFKNKNVLDIPFEIVSTFKGSLKAHTIKVPIYDRQSQPDILLGIIEDISHRTISEYKIKQYNDIVNNMHLGLCVLDYNLKKTKQILSISNINPFLLGILNKKSDEVIDKPFHKIFEFLKDLNIEKKLLDVIKKQNFIEIEDVKVKISNKKYKYFNLSAFYLPTNSICLLLEDVTHKKEFQILLKKSETNYKKLYDSMLEGYAKVNLKGEIIEFNKYFKEIIGYTDKEIKKLTYQKITPSKWHEFEQDIVETQVLKKGYSDLYEKEYIKKDGTIIPIEIQTYLSNETGENKTMWALVRDISERKKMDMILYNQLQELEAKNNEMQSFTYTVSHDLRSPLVTIKGFLDFLKDDIIKENHNRAFEDIERISTATDKMQNLLSGLLHLSRIGSVVSTFSHVNMRKIIYEITELLQGPITQNNIIIKTSENIPFAYVDSFRIREVIQNLMENAIKFTKSQPNPFIEIFAYEKENYNVFCIKDNGIGIEEKYHAKIFGIFDKLNSKNEGLGIGLAIVKKIINNHQGKIWVESDGLCHGSTFKFTIPKHTPL